MKLFYSAKGSEYAGLGTYKVIRGVLIVLDERGIIMMPGLTWSGVIVMHRLGTYIYSVELHTKQDS